MRTIAVLALAGCWCAVASAAVDVIPDAVRIAVADRQVPSVPDRVHLSGFLGGRIALSASNRLLVVDEDELLAGFRRRPGNQDWCGEHVGKWLHAGTLAWVNTGDPVLRAKLDRVVAELLECQEADGYLGTYLPGDHWTSWDVWVHKYDLLGLLTYYKYTGNRTALDGARRIGDLMCATFGLGKHDIIAAGTHFGMAATSVLEPMVLLYRQTGDPKYLGFCQYILRAWEQPNGPKIISTLTAGKGVNQVANGKAYEMLSNLVGLCELFRTTGDPKLLPPVLNAWQDIAAKRLYITGSGSYGECWHGDFDLPNSPGANLCETCVTVTWLQLNLQLLRLTGEARFADELERTVYNHLLGAQKPTGEAWCYYTALEGKKPYGTGTSCCLSSGPRGIALISTFAFTTDDRGITCNLYDTGSAGVTLRDGIRFGLALQTRYPLDGTVRLTLQLDRPARFALRLRIPDWSAGAAISVSGRPVACPAPRPGTYVSLDRLWRDGDAVVLRLPMPTVAILGDHTNADHLAIMRGPLVMAADEGHNPSLRPLRAVSLGADAASGKASGAGDAWTCSTPAKRIARTLGGKAGDTVSLSMVPFAQAGADGSRYQVWFAQTGRAAPVLGSALAFGTETWSRQGNVDGDIGDDDVHTYRVTFDGQKAKEDWYAVEVAEPVTISRIVYAHGHCFHDGGWFDSTVGKPEVQIRRAKDGQWESVGTLDAYPDTTATDAKGLHDGQEFALALAGQVQVWGLRVVGRPACGDSPGQAFSSCAELQGSK